MLRPFRRFGPSVVLPLFLSLAACGGDDGGTAPVDEGPGGGETPRDTVAPSVVSTFPEAGSGGVSVNSPLRMTFSEPVILRSGPHSTVNLKSGGRLAPGSARWTSTHVITFSPRYPLNLAASYESTLLAGTVTDTAGNPLATEHTWSFATAGSELPEVGAEAMLEHVRALAHDSMRGRFTGSAEELQAARYVRDRFREAGLAPGVEGWLQSFPVETTYTEPGTTSQNVLGVLPGEGELADEWLVVGGHYDHLGTENGEPYNGADDNASGTAMMLELARALAGHVQAGGLGGGDRRSVMFHAYGAEEVGLVGSEYYCAHPTVPMGRIVGMMNLDMVGRLREQLWVIGPVRNTSLGSLFPVVNTTDMELLYDASLINRSDQRCFVFNGKPVTFLHTGLHSDYHTFGDDVEDLNGPGMEEVANFALRALVKMILRPEPVGF